MPEGGEIAALAEFLDAILRNQDVALRLYDDSGECNRADGRVGQVQSFGKRFFVELLLPGSETRPSSVGGLLGHLGLTGSVRYVSSSVAVSLVSHRRAGKAKLAATLVWSVGQNERRLEFLSGIGSKFELSSGLNAPNDAVDLLGDESLLAGRWNAICRDNGKKSADAVLTDQNLIAGAGKRLRHRAFESCGLTGKEKLATLTEMQRGRLLNAILEAAKEERAARRSVLNRLLPSQSTPEA